MDIPNSEKISFEIRDYLDAVIHVVPNKSVDAQRAMQIYREKRGERIYRTEFVDTIEDDRILLIAESPSTNVQSRPLSYIWFWNNRLWPVYSLTLWWKTSVENKIVSFRSIFSSESVEFNLFRTRTTRIILLRGRHCISAIDLDMSAVNPAIWKLFDPNPPYEAIYDGLLRRHWLRAICHMKRQPQSRI